jgi:diketogulonate reductase-like aldo/keto reductase
MAANLAITDRLAIPNTTESIPRLGFGVYLSKDHHCVTSCVNALRAGYRHIDTAQFYGNEREVGEAVRESGLKREDVFITTKIWSAKGSVEETYQSLLHSVKTIEGSDDGAVDLFLIHTATGGKDERKMMWLALEKLLAAGKTKLIGVSNFGIGNIEEMKAYAKVWPPHVNQLEV